MNVDARQLAILSTRNRQSGAVLVVSLILLLIITLIAVSSMQGTVLEERMATNTHDRNLAFQTAESTIREAELFIESIVSLGAFNGTAGLFGLAHAEPSYYSGATWTTTATHVDATGNYGGYEAQYYIKHFTTTTGTEGALNLSGYGDNKGSGDMTVFRVTGRGTGGNADSAEVILRSHYGRIF